MTTARFVAAVSLLLSAQPAARADVGAALGAAADAVTEAARTQGRSLDQFFDGSRAAGPVRAQGIPQGELKQLMLENLDFVRSAFKAQYAPSGWKAKHSGWDLDAEVAKAKAEIRGKQGITVRDYQRILKRVLLTAKDYHVGLQVTATERATLPLQVMAAQGRYFIVHIDRRRLPEESFPFSEGDELLAIDGRKAGDLASEIQKALGGNTAGTDRALAAMMLTRRGALAPGGVPRGPVTLTLKPKGTEKVLNHQLIWDYQPELVPEPGPFGFGNGGLQSAKGPAGPRLPWLREMGSPLARELQAAGNRFGLGHREGFLPPLGMKLWESAPEAEFHAYLYKAQDGRLIGYVRIPSYGAGDPAAAVAEFAEVMGRFQRQADALVIDQLNNPGGSVFYLYALASTLSDQPLAAPRHRITLNQGDVLEAAQYLATADAIQSDEDAKKAFGETIGGYPASYTFHRHVVEFSRFILEQWNAGKRLTDPVWIWGVDKINPSQKARFTKPVLVLVNELDFSGGDFFPAILQDNRRATIFGARTAGAGGYVLSVSFPNHLGVGGFSLTGSLAERADKNPLENLGVKPDIRRALTAADLQDGFKDYVGAVNKAVSGLK